MENEGLSEKQRIEKATAEGFLRLFNDTNKTTYRVVELADSPDVRCRDDHGNTLNLEITLTQDQEKDIQAALGRSDHLSLESLRQELALVQQGKRKLSPIRSSEVALQRIATRIKEKLQKRFGPRTALVVRDTSPLGWDWENLLDRLRELIKEDGQPFDEGIWIIDNQKSKLLKVV